MSDKVSAEATQTPSSAVPRSTQLRWILIVFVLVLIADQTSKSIIRTVWPEPENFYRGEQTLFRFTHQHNPGLVGGVFRDKPLMAFAAPVLASLVLIYLYRYLNPASKVQSMAYGMIAGGAIGNLVDRVRLGWVTDFIQFHFYFIPYDMPWKYYPAFNIADSCVCTGVFLLVLHWYFFDKSHVSDNT